MQAAFEIRSQKVTYQVDHRQTNYVQVEITLYFISTSSSFLIHLFMHVIPRSYLIQSFIPGLKCVRIWFTVYVVE